MTTTMMASNSTTNMVELEDRSSSVHVDSPSTPQFNSESPENSPRGSLGIIIIIYYFVD